MIEFLRDFWLAPLFATPLYRAFLHPKKLRFATRPPKSCRPCHPRSLTADLGPPRPHWTPRPLPLQGQPNLLFCCVIDSDGLPDRSGPEPFVDWDFKGPLFRSPFFAVPDVRPSCGVFSTCSAAGNESVCCLRRVRSRTLTPLMMIFRRSRVLFKKAIVPAATRRHLSALPPRDNSPLPPIVSFFFFSLFSPLASGDRSPQCFLSGAF